MHGGAPINHRDDIDGLRAVAVVPIVLFHAGLERLSGGFIGVDIFFVISGFLITRIITADLAAGRFTMAGFYRRRIVRILPALFVMLAAVVGYAIATMLPGDIRDIARGSAAAAGFVANFWFWTDTDYFAAAADTKPLLHTWSLAVEEQFYVLYPLLLVAVQRWLPGRLPLVLAGLVLASLAAAWWLLGVDRAAGFYLLPSRIWELALGGLVAVGAVPRAGDRWRPALALCGGALILAGLFVIKPRGAFPFPWALLPTLGAALLIAYGARGPTARLLGLAPLRWIGRISYSVYLWHWPIITFYRLRTGSELSPAETAGLAALSIVAGYLSWRLVEAPMLARFRQAAPRRTVLVGASVLATVVGAALAAAATADRLHPVGPAVARIAAYADYSDNPEQQYQYNHGDCFVTRHDRYDAARCLAFSASRRNVILLGDSHAAQYWRSLVRHLPRANVMQANAAGCRPTLGASGVDGCTRLVAHVLGPLLDRRPDAIVLAARWESEDVPRLARTVRMLRARRIGVVVIGPVNEYQGVYPRLLAEAMASGDAAHLEAMRRRDRRGLDRRLAVAVTAAGGAYLSPYTIECPAERCRRLAQPGIPMHFDYGHLTLAAADLVIARLPPV